jgi:anti-anti-sigma factor
VHTLTIESDVSGPDVILSAIGELDIDTQDRFQQVVIDELGSSSVVVDLSRLDFMSISSLRSLLSCQRSAQLGRHALVYADAPRQARRLLAVSGVGDLLSVRDTVAAPLEPLAG